MSKRAIIFIGIAPEDIEKAVGIIGAPCLWIETHLPESVDLNDAKRVMEVTLQPAAYALAMKTNDTEHA